MRGVTFFRLRLCSCSQLWDSCSDSEKFWNINSDSCWHSETSKYSYQKDSVYMLPQGKIYAAAILPLIEHMLEVVTW